jgi:hypothetical protein
MAVILYLAQSLPMAVADQQDIVHLALQLALLQPVLVVVAVVLAVKVLMVEFLGKATMAAHRLTAVVEAEAQVPLDLLAQAMLIMLVVAALVLHHSFLAPQFNMLVEVQVALMTLIAFYNLVLRAVATVARIMLIMLDLHQA